MGATILCICDVLFSSSLSQFMRECSDSDEVQLYWSLRRFWENCKWTSRASFSACGLLSILCKSRNMAEHHNCKWTSGIFEASCMAGETIFMDSFEFPILKKTWLSSTKEQDVSRFKSSALAIFSDSRRKRLKEEKIVLRYFLDYKNFG